jgi:hypothetical protein
MAKDCPNSQQASPMMASSSQDARLTNVLQKRQSGRTELYNNHRPPAAVENVNLSNQDSLLEEATITLPLRKFAEVSAASMQARSNKVMRTSAQAVTFAQTDISHASAKRPYQTMKLQPGKVLLNGVSTCNTILDTGAPFSMISESFVEQCNSSQLTDSHVTTDGNTAMPANMLHGVALEIGECTFTTNLAVAASSTASSVFDILLGVDFLDTA